MTVADNTWTTRSIRTDPEGKLSKTRNQSAFSPDGKTIKNRTELSLDDGKTWMLLMTRPTQGQRGKYCQGPALTFTRPRLRKGRS